MQQSNFNPCFVCFCKDSDLKGQRYYLISVLGICRGSLGLGICIEDLSQRETRFENKRLKLYRNMQEDI